MDIFYIGEWLYKAPFKSFIPHVLNLIQMGENHKFFSLVINFVQMICSYYWISIEIFMVIVDKAATFYGSDTRSSREETSAWSQEWCTCKVFLLNTPLPHFPWCTLFAPQILHDLCFLFPWVLQESCNDMSENRRSLGPFKLNPQ